MFGARGVTNPTRERQTYVVGDASKSRGRKGGLRVASMMLIYSFKVLAVTEAHGLSCDEPVMGVSMRIFETVSLSCPFAVLLIDSGVGC